MAVPSFADRIHMVVPVGIMAERIMAERLRGAGRTAACTTRGVQGAADHTEPGGQQSQRAMPTLAGRPVMPDLEFMFQV